MHTRVLRQQWKMRGKVISILVASQHAHVKAASQLEPSESIIKPWQRWVVAGGRWSSCQISFYCALVCFGATPNSTLLLYDAIFSAGGATFSLDPVCTQVPVLLLHLYPGLGPRAITELTLEKVFGGGLGGGGVNNPDRPDHWTDCESSGSHSLKRQKIVSWVMLVSINWA